MILVTGATGLVGSHLLLHLLQSEQKIRAIYRNEASLQKTKVLFEQENQQQLLSKIEWIQADINDILALEIAFENTTQVYHCAGFISFDPKDEEKLRKINIEGTANIVNFCIAKNISKIVHVSSTAALGDLLPNETQLCETTEWNPEKFHSDYAISKYGAEMEVWRGHQEGLKVAIVNPGVIFGTGFFETGSNRFFSEIKKGISFYTNGKTGYVAVKDVVKIMEKLMNSEISGKRFVVISENKSYKEVFQKIAKSLNVKPPTREAKIWMTELYWRSDWFLSTFFGKKRIFSKSASKSAHNHEFISNKKVITTFDYEFQSVDELIDEVAANFIKTNHQ